MSYPDWHNTVGNAEYDEFDSLSFDHYDDHRWLQENTTNSRPETDSEVLRTTFLIYGPILTVNILAFCFMRLRYPRAFTVRKWSKDPELKSPLAQDQYGFFSWIWKLNSEISEDEIMEHCGLDALCFLRALSMGFKLSLMGVFNCAWLMPLYKTAAPSYRNATRLVTLENGTTVNQTYLQEVVIDKIAQYTVANLAERSPRFIGTVVAAYLLQFFVMYQILKEFEWFIEKRNKWQKQRKAQNYTIYIRSIPYEYRSNKALMEFFQKIFSYNDVVEARIRCKCPALVRKVNKRAATIAKFENLVAYEELTGIVQEKKTGLLGLGLLPAGEKVNSIARVAEEIKQLNKDISQRIDAIQAKLDKDDPLEDELRAQAALCQSLLAESMAALEEGKSKKGRRAPPKEALAAASKKSDKESKRESAKSLVSEISKITSLVTGSEDGEYYSAGFVTFKTLSATHAARQLVHHSNPQLMKVEPAPHPKDIFWINVGRTHRELSFGRLVSAVATVVTCFIWTIPMTFFSSLSNTEKLKRDYKGVSDAIDNNENLELFLQMIAPLLLIGFNAIVLPGILKFYSMLEGPLSWSVVEASTFAKQSTFMIIQTFFVSLVTGGSFKGIAEIFTDPNSTLDLLGETLPNKSTYFMQIGFIRTTVYLQSENWRVLPLFLAIGRKFFGPQLTEKQRSQDYMGFKPLSNPLPFELSFNMSQICVLYFVILLVYQAIAPLTSFVLAFCFNLSRTSYLHQFVYIYPKSRDSGGIIWLNFIKVVLGIQFIAEGCVVAILFLRKAGIVTPLMIPLFVLTGLFNAYIRQDHFPVTENLPSKECLDQDNLMEDEPTEFLERAYLQEDLQHKELFPDDPVVSDVRLDQLGLRPTIKEKEDDGSESTFDDAASESSDFRGIRISDAAEAERKPLKSNREMLYFF